MPENICLSGKMGELRIKYDDLFKEFSSMQQDYILKRL